MPKAIDFEHQRMTVSLAKMEGFADVYSFFAFFKQNYGGYFEGYLTKWRLI